MRKFFRNSEYLHNQLGVLLNIFSAHMQANLIAPVVFSFDTSAIPNELFLAYEVAQRCLETSRGDTFSKVLYPQWESMARRE